MSRPTWVWPAAEADMALEALARSVGLARTVQTSPRRTDADSDDLGPRLKRIADGLGCEVEAVEVPYAEVETLLCGAGPALLRWQADAEGGWVAILGHRFGRLRILTPAGRVTFCSLARMRDWMCHGLEVPELEAVDGLVRHLGLSPRREKKARAAFLAERLGGRRLGGCWLLRPSPSSDFRAQLRWSGLPRQIFEFVLAYIVGYGCLLGSWWILGAGALAGMVSRDWLLAWGLALLSVVPLRLWGLWSQARITVTLGAALKRRLLVGALRFEPDEIRHQGAGQLLGRVIESEAVEHYSLLGGFLAVAGLVELAMSAWVLSLGAGGLVHVAVLGSWLILMIWLVHRYLRQRFDWTDERLDMTHSLVESMVGHRTRQTQEPPRQRHEEEDRALAAYLEVSKPMDRTRSALMALVPRGWMVVGLAVLMPTFVLGGGPLVGLALGVGGVLTAYRGFSKVSEGTGYLASAWISWLQARSMFEAAARPVQPGEDLPSTSGSGRPLIELDGVVYRHRGRSRPVIDGVGLQIYAGDRLLLEGPSGGGKSTLSAVLTGLRQADSGLLFIDGLDHHSLGQDTWRRRVVSAPQFHENHVFAETVAFNLLMGRAWPPSPDDLREAEAVCQELGLGPLLERMPAGLQQMVGETGWQLSHGERSRLFMARALLQRADLVVLDESFAALDPENAERAMDCVLKRSKTLLLIAHP